MGKVAEDNKKVGGDVTAFSLDASNPAHRKELIQKVTEKLGGLDTLVIVPPQNEIVGEIIETTGDEFDKVSALNPLKNRWFSAVRRQTDNSIPNFSGRPASSCQISVNN